ncbi:hypothetical protein AX17_000084 [Amanita inopinata Kibby_2008]|nr:hypothetical protein AX17_000084 [Amanita inopinata Kibby_2008]
MSSIWDQTLSAQSESSREFLTPAQLFVSNAAALTLRKPQSRKKSERRDLLSIAGTDDARRVKEKHSFLILSKTPAGTGQWRDVTCKLLEEKGRCFFSIYLDGTILYQTIFVHLLNQTAVRLVDNSLFFRKHCLGIYSPSDKRQTTAETNEPVFLQFGNADICGTWAVLLKSYAIPEVYGLKVNTSDGGSFRMWRQIELTVIQGRNLGNTRPNDSSIGFEPEPELTDFRVSCEILLNETVCGRTTPKKGSASPLWHETITISDIPPFKESDHLEIRVWRERKTSKPSFLGSVRIALKFFPHTVDQGWYPVLQNQKGALSIGTQAGELQLKLRVDQEIILPQSAYARLLDTFNSRNFLDWMSDFEKILGLTTVSIHLVSIAAAKNALVEQVLEYAEREMERTPFSRETLFRGNTILTKVMEICMVWYGKAFLEASIGTVVRRLCEERVTLEIDSERNSKGVREAGGSVDLKQLKQLIEWCREIWMQIYSVRAECPEEIRRLFSTIRKLVEKRLQADPTWHEKYSYLPWQSVSAFCFLRFIAPAILHPHLFGICPGIPSLPVKRSLTLIAKVIQSLANFSSTNHKENFMSMKDVQDFLKESRDSMVDYLTIVSGELPTYPKTIGDPRDRLKIVNALRERSVLMSALEREAIPILPHFSDVPRHLACITTSVYRQRHRFGEKSGSRNPDLQSLGELCSRCSEVQQEAAFRVFNPTPDEASSGSQASHPPAHHCDAVVQSSVTRPARALLSRRQTLNGEENKPPNTVLQQSSLSRPAESQTNRYQTIHKKSMSSDSVPSIDAEENLLKNRPLYPVDLPTDFSDDGGGRKKKLLKGILRL